MATKTQTALTTYMRELDMEGDSEKESYYELDDIFGPESIDNYDRLIQMQCNPDLIKKAMKHL